ncbi:MAG: hypothetical protein E7480_00315 [Ruminococcaceae bacterium]|nr:hypothetical protein [Oscillospiraceae bacterium]
MKKILSVLLIVMMLLSVIGIMTGCGDETAADTSSVGGTSSTDTNSKNDVTLPAALANITKINVPNIADTGWTLSGGMIDGVEMEQEDLDNVRNNFGGTMNFYFVDNTKVMLSNGDNALESTYKITDEVLYMDFNEYKYHAVFTDIQGTTVMIVANDTDPNSALYFVLVDEH